ncbi:hypothetical protein N0V93_005827 [Gnomoniopsis smithogilvyi]|uniref:Sialidase domain-containing protein n=1 Tax=Gnomoniopsis smithogilvyi TaxID=1191159 RepID=A0A9W8YXC5_9PEZI|nr:hypothetical protein N0V93_005827 [Gnomoniopsis smithogilvyi]
MRNILCFAVFHLATILDTARGDPIPRAIQDLNAATFESRAAATVSAAEPVVTVASTGTYLRVNSVTYANGTSGLIGAYTDTTDSGSNRILRVVQSTDEGQSWDIIGSVAQGEVATSDIDNPFPLQIVPGGRIICAYRNHDIDATTGDYTYYRITLSYSDDWGVSWSYLAQVTERAATSVNNGVWEPFCRLANDGTTIQCYYSSESAADDQDSLMQYSTDGGETWSTEIAVSGQNVTSRDGMTGVAVVEDDTLICVFENTEDGPFSIRSVLSYDDGLTWDETTRSIVYDPSNTVSTAQAPAIINVGGTLVVSFITNEDTPTDTSGDADGGTVKVITSLNTNIVWADKTSISTGAHWPGLYSLGSSDFLVLYGSDTVGVASREYTV